MIDYTSTTGMWEPVISSSKDKWKTHMSTITKHCFRLLLQKQQKKRELISKVNKKKPSKINFFPNYYYSIFVTTSSLGNSLSWPVVFPRRAEFLFLNDVSKITLALEQQQEVYGNSTVKNPLKAVFLSSFA